MKFLWYAAIMSLSGLIACKSSSVKVTPAVVQSPQSTAPKDSLLPYKRIASSQLTAPIRYEFNNDQTLVLCLNETEPTMENRMRHTVSYLVYDVKNDRIIHQAQLANGYVGWFSNTQLRVKPIVEAGDINSNIPYVYDLVAKKRINNQEVPH